MGYCFFMAFATVFGMLSICCGARLASNLCAVVLSPWLAQSLFVANFTSCTSQSLKLAILKHGVKACA